MSSILNDFRELGVPFSLNLSPGVGWKDNDARNTFAFCNNYNAPFNIPSTVMNCYGMFNNCISLNSPIHIDPYGSVNVMDSMFCNCYNFQQDINIPVSCGSWYGLVNGGYYDEGWLSQRYEGNIHMYSNKYQWYPEGILPQAFSSWYGFNGNVIFHDVYPIVMASAFEYDGNLNRNICLPDSVENMSYCFGYCYNLNQNIHIPSSAVDCSHMFIQCNNLNQAISVPDGVNAYEMFSQCNHLNCTVRLPSGGNMHSMFKYCNNLNQPFDVPYYATVYDPDYDYTSGSETAVSSCAGYVMFAYCDNLNSMVTFNDDIESMCGTFEDCDLFNQNVVMPSHLKYSIDTFSGCNESFNQNIAFPEGMIEMNRTFCGCTHFNQNIRIPSTVKKLHQCFTGTAINQNIQIPSGCANTAFMFSDCPNLNQNILIPTSVRNACNMFRQCDNLNSEISIPEGVINCEEFAYWCRNLYIPEAVIPSSARSIHGVFDHTKVLNINIRTNYFEAWCDDVVNVALAANTSGKTPMTLPTSISGSTWTFLYSDWQQISWGTPIGEFKIPIDANVHVWAEEEYPILYQFYSRQMYGIGHSSYSQWSAEENYGGVTCIQTTNDDPMTIFIPSIGVQYVVPEYQVVYADYPNATSESDVNYYWYKITFY